MAAGHSLTRSLVEPRPALRAKLLENCEDLFKLAWMASASDELGLREQLEAKSAALAEIWGEPGRWMACTRA